MRALRKLIASLAIFLVLLASWNVPVSASTAGARWVGAWAASPVVGTEIPWTPDCPAGKGLENASVRNVVFLSAGGSSVRVRLTNAFGKTPMRITRVTIAKQASDANAVPGSLRTLTFGGRRGVTVPAGSELFSDPTRLTVTSLSKLLVSVYVREATGPITNHPFTAQGNYLASGDHSNDVDGTAYVSQPCWMFVNGIDVAPAGRYAGSVVALGDSITDTSATTGNVDHRYPDYLARRLNALPGRTLSVLNAGLGGNRLLLSRPDGDYWGVPVVERLDRDVFAQTGVTDVILLIGVNDINFDATPSELIAGYKKVIAETHKRGLRIFGGTVMPFGGSFLWTESRQRTADTVNAWIRTSRAFDGVVDFAAATADPADPQWLLPIYDSGDHLHPRDAGTKAMADAVELNALLR